MRTDDWQERFGDWCERAQKMKFEYGRNDCALMCASCAEAITGKHPAPDLLGAYYTPLGAYRVLLERGGLDGICDTAFSERCEPESARRGDIILCENGRKQMLTICNGVNLVVASDTRAEFVRRGGLKELTAWRVG